jgi:hypothetical protein
MIEANGAPDRAAVSIWWQRRAPMRYSELAPRVVALRGEAYGLACLAQWLGLLVGADYRSSGGMCLMWLE